MEKINRKRLNNKGFTLIELLAVVVILAVVMGIAMTSVLSSMNNSRKGSLENSATSVSQAFQTKYSEAMVTQSMNNVYGAEMNLTGASTGYNFNTASSNNVVFYKLNEALKDELNLSPSTYVLEKANAVSTLTKGENGISGVSESFIAFNGKTMVACLVANQSGSYYVADFAENTTASVLGTTVTFASGSMWSCSLDGVNSWTSVS